MIYVKSFYGGMCNNILQINNIIDFIDKYKLNINDLKFRNIRNSCYRHLNFDYIFNELKPYLIDKPLEIGHNINHIIYNRDDLSIDKNNDILLCNNFYTRIRYHEYAYDFLKILEKQNQVFDEYSKYLDSNNIAFHIRRGDYLNHNIYKKYVRSDSNILDIIEKNINKQVIIFSDGTEYIKNLCSMYSNILYAADLKMNIGVEFLFGTVCNNVIQNKYSSFSLLMNEYNILYKKYK